MAGRGGKRSTSFKPGQVTNPRGRAKLPPDVKALFREKTMEFAQTVIDLAVNCDIPSVRLAACQEGLNRGWGKPSQPVTGENGEGPVKAFVEVVYRRPDNG